MKQVLEELARDVGVPINADFSDEVITSPVNGIVVSTGMIDMQGHVPINAKAKLEDFLGSPYLKFRGGTYIHLRAKGNSFWVTPYEGHFIHKKYHCHARGLVFSTKHFDIGIINSSSNGMGLEYHKDTLYRKGIRVGYFGAGLNMLLCFPVNDNVLVNDKEKITMGGELIYLGKS